jgi:hypothetical protein
MSGSAQTNGRTSRHRAEDANQTPPDRLKHLAEHEAEPLLRLYERAIELGYANTGYALSNPDEFFAVSYADYLRHRHELPGVPLDDDDGIQHDLRVYFDQLATA